MTPEEIVNLRKCSENQKHRGILRSFRKLRSLIKSGKKVVMICSTSRYDLNRAINKALKQPNTKLVDCFAPTYSEDRWRAIIETLPDNTNPCLSLVTYCSKLQSHYNLCKTFALQWTEYDILIWGNPAKCDNRCL